MIEIVTEPIDMASLEARVADPRAGAIVTRLTRVAHPMVRRAVVRRLFIGF